jgi:hypothetical protein
MRYTLTVLAALCLCLFTTNCISQDNQHNLPQQQDVVDKSIDYPSRFLDGIQSKTSSLDKLLCRQTQKYLERMSRREARLQKKLYKIDSSSAKRLFNNSNGQYASLARQLKADTGSSTMVLKGEYLPNTDTLKTSLSFLQQNPKYISSGENALSPQMQAKLQQSISELQALQAKMQNADQVSEYMQARKEQINQYISQYTNLSPGLLKEYQGMKQDVYYYSQQVKEYKESLNDPDKLAQKAIAVLNKLPVFQQFMKSNSQLAALFSQSGNMGTPAALIGLQTRDQMQQILQGQVASGGPDALGAMQNSFESAQTQLNQLRNKLSELGQSGGGSAGMPDFKPNPEKTHSFLKRLEIGTNLQTIQSSQFYPTLTDLGLSIGYKLNNTSTIGIGGSLKIGWGSDIQHIAISWNGAGIRSFLDIKLKGSISATGGLEYNYTSPISSFHDIDHLSYWTPSGLIGVTKTISVKSKAFKKTKLQLLWDFLSYQQIPRRTPILFRVGYTF